MLQILSRKILTSTFNASKKQNGYKIKGIVANRCRNELQEPDQVDLLYLNPSYSTIVFVPSKTKRELSPFLLHAEVMLERDLSSCHAEFRQDVRYIRPDIVFLERVVYRLRLGEITTFSSDSIRLRK
jgi:hypothetical protein